MSSEELSNVSPVTIAEQGRSVEIAQTLQLVRKIFGSKLVELRFFDDLAVDQAVIDNNCASTLLTSNAGDPIGLLALKDLSANELGSEGEEILTLFGKSIVQQLATLERSNQLNKKQQQYHLELQQYKNELESAYEDLNQAHEELNEAFNTTMLLSRSLSRSRVKLNGFLQQAPIALGVLRHRQLKIEVANKLMLDLWGKDKTIIGMPLASGIPELVGQPYLEILDNVYTSGERYVGKAARVELYKDGRKTDSYFNFIYEPLKNERGITKAIMIVATDVSELVNRRQEPLIQTGK
ncbi:PAS domain-containing protein [Pedobacter endophyticus]|uniref:PAS domain-containing protein n=1 Tax=Pedobacter endophyticus TaxID=2789740 RepID=A0A7S9L312_9SPHI|nr:PAS domain-containing protein [Pedobacter endophyticus]QPH41564.1 PAS domain-containing protein [Pedobacter endophyticus]